MALISIFHYGVLDVVDSFSRRTLWWNLAREDISDSFKRTLLGPFWILLTYSVFVLAIYVVIANQNEVLFLAYIAVGLLVWNFVSEVIGQSANLFIREAAFVKGTTLPLSLYAFRLVGKSSIRLFYTLFPSLTFVYFAVGGTGGVSLTAYPAIMLLIVTAPAVVLVLGITGTLFPDIEFVVQNGIRVMFFLSPVFWHPGGEGIRQIVYAFNPLTHFIEIVRDPLVSGVVPGESWLVATILSILIWIAAIFLLGRYRDRIVFLL